MPPSSQYFSGKVTSVVFSNPEKAFYICKVLLDGHNYPLVVKGSIPGITVKTGLWFGFEAFWDSHPKYGKQLTITKAPLIKDSEWDSDTIISLLTTNGVKEFLLYQILYHFGEDQFASALKDKIKLSQVTGLTEDAANYITSRWDFVRAQFKTLAFLSEIGVPSSRIQIIWGTFGDQAEYILSQNPWKLIEIEGISFNQVEEIAQKLNVHNQIEDKLRAAILYCLRSQIGSFGHLYLQGGQLYSLILNYIPDVDKKLYGEQLLYLRDGGLIILERIQGTIVVYDPWAYQLETTSANLLFRQNQVSIKAEYNKAISNIGPKALFAYTKDPTNLEEIVKAAINEWESQGKLNLSEEQKQGVLYALIKPVSILTGEPGTGKTTALKAVVKILQDVQIPFLLCAPTGIAAKRLEAVTGAPAFTIHKAFSAQGNSEEERESGYVGITGERDSLSSSLKEDSEWGYNSDNYHPAEIVIVDETSMVDQHLLFRLLTCTGPNCRFVFVGDHFQLPSVGPGNILRDLINSEVFPVTKLGMIFRQSDTSAIVYAAHAMNRGDLPETTLGGAFTLIPTESEDKIVSYITKLAHQLYGKRANFQILSPKHNGTLGVTNLNQVLREELNPKQAGLTEVPLRDAVVREDDRIMVVKNNYKLGIYNGDVGKIAKINIKEKTIDIKIHGKPPFIVSLNISEAARLIRLAYACTIHKCQGLEYDTIVIPVIESFKHQLQRNLYYTAITRAKKQVLLIGTQSALAKAIANAKEDARNTYLAHRLKILAGI